MSITVQQSTGVVTATSASSIDLTFTQTITDHSLILISLVFNRDDVIPRINGFKRREITSTPGAKMFLFWRIGTQQELPFYRCYWQESTPAHVCMSGIEFVQSLDGHTWRLDQTATQNSPNNSSITSGLTGTLRIVDQASIFSVGLVRDQSISNITAGYTEEAYGAVSTGSPSQRIALSLSSNILTATDPVIVNATASSNNGWTAFVITVASTTGADSVLPDDYNSSNYFDGKLDKDELDLAGYNYYRRWLRTDGSDYFSDFAQDIYDTYLSGSTGKVLELGCAKGFLVEDLLNLGVDMSCIDVSQYAFNEASQAVKNVMTVGDVRTLLSSYADDEFEYIFSVSLLECLKDSDLDALILEMNRVSLNQFHYVIEDANIRFYAQRSGQDLVAKNFNVGTDIIEIKSGNKFTK